MKAKKILGGGLELLLVVVVGAFLALHSINLFQFVFPIDQQYLAYLGFGLTGLGALIYIYLFLYKAKTTLQKSVSLGMGVVCSIGEVLAAIFGMQIESWKKAGFALTENDFQTMLMVIGILSILHFFAIITYYAGDRIGELLSDDDGDGVPNAVDPDWRAQQKPASPASAPSNGKSVRLRTYTLPEMLNAVKMSKDEFRVFLAETDNVYSAWKILDHDGLIPADLGMKNFRDLAISVAGQRANP